MSSKKIIGISFGVLGGIGLYLLYRHHRKSLVLNSEENLGGTNNTEKRKERFKSPPKESIEIRGDSQNGDSYSSEKLVGSLEDNCQKTNPAEFIVRPAITTSNSSIGKKSKGITKTITVSDGDEKHQPDTEDSYQEVGLDEKHQPDSLLDTEDSYQEEGLDEGQKITANSKDGAAILAETINVPATNEKQPNDILQHTPDLTSQKLDLDGGQKTHVDSQEDIQISDVRTRNFSSQQSLSSQHSLEMDIAPVSPRGRNFGHETFPVFDYHGRDDMIEETLENQDRTLLAHCGVLSIRDESTNSLSESSETLTRNDCNMSEVIDIESQTSSTAIPGNMISDEQHLTFNNNISSNRNVVCKPDLSDKFQKINNTDSTVNYNIGPSETGSPSIKDECEILYSQSESISDDGITISSSNVSPTERGHVPQNKDISTVNFPQDSNKPHTKPSNLTEAVETISDLEDEKDILDVVFLHADLDITHAEDFITDMMKEFPELNLNMMRFENLDFGMSMFESAAKLFDTSRFLFVLVTKNFLEAGLQRFLNEVFLIDVITFKEKNCRLIPVILDRNCYLPELAPLIPLQYHRYLEAKSRNTQDRTFLNTFRKLIKNGRDSYLKS